MWTWKTTTLEDFIWLSSFLLFRPHSVCSEKSRTYRKALNRLILPEKYYDLALNMINTREHNMPWQEPRFSRCRCQVWRHLFWSNTKLPGNNDSMVFRAFSRDNGGIVVCNDVYRCEEQYGDFWRRIRECLKSYKAFYS